MDRVSLNNFSAREAVQISNIDFEMHKRDIHISQNLIMNVDLFKSKNSSQFAMCLNVSFECFKDGNIVYLNS